MSLFSLLSSAPALPELLQLPLSPVLSAVSTQLPMSNAYIFTYSLFQRTALMTTPASVQYTCTQLNCKYSTTIPSAKVISTGNLLKHYYRQHKSIPTSCSDAKAWTKPAQPQSPFFCKYSTGLSLKRYQKLLLNMIVKNNLLLSLVESALF
jgi:hypothetical protein